MAAQEEGKKGLAVDLCETTSDLFFTAYNYLVR